jgi:hypothetical protein
VTTSESAFINDIKDIAIRVEDAQARRQAAEARLRRLERELEATYRGHPRADEHIARELADLRKAMLIELDRGPPATIGSLFDTLVRLSRRHQV